MSDDPNDDSSVWTIAMIVAGGLILVVVLGLVFFM